MQIIGLDLSKQGTGVAIGDGSGPPTTFKVTFAGHSIADTMAEVMRWSRGILAMEKPAFVMIEKTFIAPTDDAYRQSLMLGIEAVVLGMTSLRQIPAKTVAVSKWRKDFLGYGNYSGDEAKRRCIQLCTTLGWPHHGDHNCAEAAGVWAYAHLHHGNKRGMNQMLSHGSFKRMAG